MYKEIIERLLSLPQKGQIKIDFDLKKKIFRMSVPIFSSKQLPGKVREYALARENLTFKPHATAYRIEGEKVFLIQEVPFSFGFQSSSRGDVEEFWKMSQHCHKMLTEIAIEDKYRTAFYLGA